MRVFKIHLQHNVELTVLVIDDDYDCRQVLTDYLTHVRLAVISAENGREALRLLTRGQLRPNVILLDLAMPSMDGASFVESMQRDPSLRRIPVIIVSAFGEAEAPSPKGVVGRFMKPLDLPMIERHLRYSARKPENTPLPRRY